ncbi:MAG: hypothetical protein ABT01_02700 [Clostridium sp. SCN 57-10]|nr:MAG: hypothetical protein ABT01_02700 [Clostridium sp. SCN 57-10]
MRILVHAAGDKTIRVVFPTRLLFNSLTALLAKTAVQKYVPGEAGAHLQAHDIRRLMRELNRMKRIHPHLELVSVDSADGDHIRITL